MSDWDDRIIREFREKRGHCRSLGRGLALLHNRGAKSSAEYVSPVAGIRLDDGSYLVAASNSGEDRHPGWYHNLLAHPDVQIETPDEGTLDVRAVDLPREERDPAWRRFTERSAGFRSYEEKTSRVIPVLKLTPRTS